MDSSDGAGSPDARVDAGSPGRRRRSRRRGRLRQARGRRSVDRVYGDTLDRGEVQAFKDAGGFHNDRELTDAVALYVLADRFDGTYAEGDQEELSRAALDDLHEGLTETIHRHGAQYETDTLVERATGEWLTAEPFLEYANAKYRDLYDC